MIEHATGEQFTRTDVGEQGYRWLAPEICFGDNVVTTAADVFSFARTILEVCRVVYSNFVLPQSVTDHDRIKTLLLHQTNT